MGQKWQAQTWLRPLLIVAVTAGWLTLTGQVAVAAPSSFTADGTFVVPTGATAVVVEAFGAQGGDALNGCLVPVVLAGQAGGSAVATFDVAPGDVLNVHVGGRGGTGGISCDAVGPGGLGGENGGGAGGASDARIGGGGGGGGASDVRRGGDTLADRIVVGGGGGGEPGSTSTGTDLAGAGGGTVGEDGSNDVPNCAPSAVGRNRRHADRRGCGRWWRP